MKLNGEAEPEQECSRYFKFKDFIECSDTYKSIKCNNAPKQNKTYEAISALATEVLDKVYDEFGSVVLTYGFCSSELNKNIPKNNYPKLDQHAGHELNTKGNPICARLGFAADFMVPDVSSLVLSRYIVSNLKFDRLYYYGRERPVHVSLNNTPVFKTVLMREYGEKRIPSNITKHKFLYSKITF